MIDPAKADAEWERNTDKSKQTNGRAKGIPGVKPRATTEDPMSAGPSYAASRAIREAYQARLAKIIYEEKIGKLVPSEQVRLEAFELARTVRDAVLNIPNRISSEIASETEPVKVHAMLTRALTEALEELHGKRRRGL